MHIQLTDILACPVCGPPHGLILRADTMRERRVEEGALGCPNCERNWPVANGVAWLDPDASRIPGDTVTAGTDADPEATIRMAALLGLDHAKGFVLVTGPAAAVSAAVATMADGVEVIADARCAGPGPISRIAVGKVLPFYGGRLHGIWLSGETADRLLEEAARALHPLGRLVLDPAPSDAADRLTASGLKIAAQQDRTVLATRA